MGGSWKLRSRMVSSGPPGLVYRRNGCTPPRMLAVRSLLNPTGAQIPKIAIQATSGKGISSGCLIEGSCTVIDQEQFNIVQPRWAYLPEGIQRAGGPSGIVVCLVAKRLPKRSPKSNPKMATHCCSVNPTVTASGIVSLTQRTIHHCKQSRALTAECECLIPKLINCHNSHKRTHATKLPRIDHFGAESEPTFLSPTTSLSLPNEGKSHSKSPAPLVSGTTVENCL